MSTWTDADGHKWSIDLDGPKLKRIRDEFGVNLTALDASPWLQLDQDLILRVDIIWMLCAEQASRSFDWVIDPEWAPDEPNDEPQKIRVLGVSEERFALKLAGEGLANATEALMQAVSDFFPPERRSKLQSLLARTETLTKAAMEQLENPEVDEKLKETVKQEVSRMIDDHLMRFGQPTKSQGS